MVRATQTTRKSSEKTDKPDEKQQAEQAPVAADGKKKQKMAKKIRVEKVQSERKKKFRNSYKTTVSRCVVARSLAMPPVNHAAVHNMLSEAVSQVNEQMKKHAPMEFEPINQISHDAIGTARYAVGVIGADLMTNALPFASRDRRLTVMPKDIWVAATRNPWLMRTMRKHGIRLGSYMRGRK